jgi:hypothetical protein
VKAILHLAECATFLGQIDIFKIRGKFASTDAYEDHFLLPKGKIFLITHRRVLLLQVRQLFFYTFLCTCQSKFCHMLVCLVSVTNDDPA